MLAILKMIAIKPRTFIFFFFFFFFFPSLVFTAAKRLQTAGINELVTETFMIPNDKVGLVIGRSGEVIKYKTNKKK